MRIRLLQFMVTTRWRGNKGCPRELYSEHPASLSIFGHDDDFVVGWSLFA